MAAVLALDDVSLDFLARKRAGGGRRRDQLKRAAGAQEKTRVVGLNGVSLAVAPGEVVALVGPPESGMTTLLRVAAGVLRPDSGTASYPADRMAWFSGARLTDGTLTLRQNVELLVGLFGRAPVADTDFARHCVTEMGLMERLNTPMENLPSSTGSRLGLVVALSLPAPLYVLDGPLDSGTREFRQQVRTMIEAAAATGSAIIVSTDKGSTLLGPATRAVRLRKGRVVEDGAPEEILTRPDKKGRAGRSRPQTRRPDDDDDEDTYG
jgi:ABC-type multidrug transport system ATPase subunit